MSYISYYVNCHLSCEASCTYMYVYMCTILTIFCYLTKFKALKENDQIVRRYIWCMWRRMSCIVLYLTCTRYVSYMYQVCTILYLSTTATRIVQRRYCFFHSVDVTYQSYMLIRFSSHLYLVVLKLHAVLLLASQTSVHLIHPSTFDQIVDICFTQSSTSKNDDRKWYCTRNHFW